MLITQKLWERNYDVASLSLNTKFVQGIKNGDLPKTKFQEYLAQDYFFLESFARAYGLAVSKSRNKKNIKTKRKEVVHQCRCTGGLAPGQQAC